MQIVVNGEKKNVKQHITISGLIEMLGIKVKVMAAAVNMEIVKKEEWDSYMLEEDDKIELLQFVGGG
ncbi:MAG: sulfur carrier protein ThiS [Sulfurovum sp.]|nr:sulfur carrier protein ThiS [Sulfurovum sp.]MDD3603215.1 sulfur carrier protein ThiS [Sulfurovum sp.]